jgi:hypothetical protein
MPSQIKVVSWNIQNIGSSKLQKGPRSTTTFGAEENSALDFIQSVIQSEQANAVGIMEVLSSKATYIADKMKTRLGNGWQAKESSPQTHTSRHEQYIYLWKQEAAGAAGIAGMLETDQSPSPCWTYGVVDNNALNTFFSTLGNDSAARRKEIFECLKANGYIDTEMSVDKKALAEFKATVIGEEDDDGDFFDDGTGEESDDDISGDEEDEESGSEDESGSEEEDYKSVSFKITTTANFDVDEAVDYNSVYITFRLNTTKWNDLKNNNVPLNLVNKSGEQILTLAQLTDLGNKLKQIDIVLFPSLMERGPFLLNLDLKDTANTSVPLLLGVLHAPAPGKESATDAQLTDIDSRAKKRKFTALTEAPVNQAKFEAVNNLALCPPFLNAPNLLLMGDFNLTYLDSVDTFNVPVYDRDVFSGEYKFAKTSRTETIVGGFAKIKTTLGADDLIGNKLNTSLTSQEAAAKAASANPLWGAFPASYTANPYDRFFLKKQGSLGSQPAGLVDLIAKMNNAAAADLALAEAGMKFLRWSARLTFITKAINALQKDLATTQKRLKAFNSGARAKPSKPATSSPDMKRRKADDITAADIQLTIDGLNAQIAFLNNLQATLNDATVTAPQDAITSYIAYSLFSDHLPISVELTYGA